MEALQFCQNIEFLLTYKNLIFTIAGNKKEERHLMCRSKIILLNIFLEMLCSFYVIRVHECGKISRFSHLLESYRCYFFSRRKIRQLFVLRKENFFSSSIFLSIQFSCGFLFYFSSLVLDQSEYHFLQCSVSKVQEEKHSI